MKAIFIAYNQAYNQEIVQLLEGLGQRGYTVWTEVGGRGSLDGEPHLGSHAWPAQNHAVLTAVEDSLAPKIMDALRENGIEPDPMLTEETGGCFGMPETYEGVCRLMGRANDFTALFMLSDTTAMAGIKALADHGKSVPRDVSVIAIDGLNVSEYSIPTLTTMVQPAEEMARESVRILMKMLEDSASEDPVLEKEGFQTFALRSGLSRRRRFQR